jgi:hypothetical protein
MRWPETNLGIISSTINGKAATVNSSRKMICFAVLGLTVCLCPALLAQAASQATMYAPDPSTVMIDVMALDAKTGAVLPDLKKEDFQVLDNGREMSVVSFGSGAHYGVAPIALWLVIECNNFGPPDFTSAFLRGKTQYLQPALAHLDKTDVVGVAHWCSNGTQEIDLPPGNDADAAISKLDELLSRKSIEGENRKDEDAKNRLVGMILDETKKNSPQRLPVIVFLYGDAGSAYEIEADDILRSLLSVPSVVYGLNNAGYHFDPRAMYGAGQIYYEVHYLSRATGGDVYGSPDFSQLTKGLNYIVMQAHFRDTLGFKPDTFDGKKHDLRVELTPEGQKQFPSAVLKYRSQYIPADLAKGLP